METVRKIPSPTKDSIKHNYPQTLQNNATAKYKYSYFLHK